MQAKMHDDLWNTRSAQCTEVIEHISMKSTESIL